MRLNQRSFACLVGFGIQVGPHRRSLRRHHNSTGRVTGACENETRACGQALPAQVSRPQVRYKGPGNNENYLVERNGGHYGSSWNVLAAWAIGFQLACRPAINHTGPSKARAFPSLWYRDQCRSHFWITPNQVR
jgi:hypothetical protein